MVTKRLLLLFASFLALVCPALAQSSDVGGGSGGSGAPDDSYWSDGSGGTVHLDVTENPSGSPEVWTTATSAGGFTNAAGGTAGADLPSGLDTCRNSGTMTNAAGEQFRVRNGRLQKKGADGKWRNMRKVPKPKKGSTTRSSTFGWQRMSAGDAATEPGFLSSRAFGEVHLSVGDVAPFDGMFLPGDEVVSLPAI